MSVQPLQRVLTLQSLLAIGVPFVAAVLLGFIWILPQIRNDAGERQALLARAVGMQVESHLETAAAIVRSVAAMPPDSRSRQQLDALFSATDAMNCLYVVSADGTVSQVALGSGDQKHRADLINLNLSRNPLFLDVSRSRKPIWSETFLSVISGGLSVAYGAPGVNSVVIGQVDLAILSKFLQQISMKQDVLIMIVDHNGQVVADNNGRFTAQQLNIGNISLVRRGLDSDQTTSGPMTFDGNAMTGSLVHIPNLDWHVLVAKTDKSLYRAPRNIALIALAGILAALACSLGTSVFLSRKLALRFGDLTGHAREIARGAASSDWPSSTIDEFNQLSATLQHMARQLQDSETLYRTLFEQLPDGVVLWSLPDLKPLQFNTTAHLLHGYTREEFSQLSIVDLDADLDQARIQAMTDELRKEKTLRFESRLRTKTGEHRSIYISLQLVEISGQAMILAIQRDITELKQAETERIQLEKQLLHAQKLESLGVLAGGIAHDFNNILMAILGNAEMALLRINRESPAVENLHRIEQAAARAAELARQMLAYSGKGKFVVENLDMNCLLEEMLHMLKVSISKKAVLRFNLHQPLPSVEADATQIRQIIMNLVINASEAIGDKSGFISVTTGCMECDQGYLKDVWLDETLAPGRYVYLEISDTGCGMDKDTLAKLFDPFFTTKFTGRGLGMAAVQGIVRGHKGAIKVYSEAGKGTSFKVLFPATGRPADTAAACSVSNSWQGSGTVLLVDDEEDVLRIGSEMLSMLGFAVVAAGDGREALEIFRNTPDIAVVILDLTMPHMDGEQCYRELRQLKPEVKVIVSSGYNEQEVTQKFMGKGLAGFVQKPYRLSVLQEVLRNAVGT